MTRSPHPALDVHLRRLPLRVCVDWGLVLHSRCGICHGSTTTPAHYLMNSRPWLADHAIEDIAQRGQCRRCKWPYLVVYLSDDSRGPGCQGCGYDPWGLPVADRRDSASAGNGPDNPVVSDEFAPPWRPRAPNPKTQKEPPAEAEGS